MYMYIYICIYICTRVQTQWLSQSSSALLPLLDCVLNQIGWTWWRTWVFNSWFSAFNFFCRELRILEGKNLLFGQKSTRCVLRKVEWVCWLVRLNVYVSFIGVRSTNTSLTLINRTRLGTKGQSAGYPQAQIEINSTSFQRRAPAQRPLPRSNFRVANTKSG